MGYSQTVNEKEYKFRGPGELGLRLDAEARTQGCSAAEVVRRALEAYLVPREGLRAAREALGPLEMASKDWKDAVIAEMGDKAPQTPWEWIDECRRRLGPVEAARLRARTAHAPTEAEIAAGRED